MLGVILQTLGGFGGFNIGDLFNSLANFGFFAYVLPFLLIFATVFAIMSKIEIFKENRGAAMIIALAIGLLSLQFPNVSQFFAVIFKNLSIGISILLAALILAGIFLMNMEKSTSFNWIFFGLGGLIFIVVTFASLSSPESMTGWNFRYWWSNYGGLIIFLFVLIGVIVALAMSKGNGSTTTH